MGYPVVTYKVQTPDGYILTMFRIPNDHSKNPNARYHPIYLQHGLVATCATFLGKGKDSLGKLSNNLIFYFFIKQEKTNTKLYSLMRFILYLIYTDLSAINISEDIF